ncbi:hypothetical protein [Pelosinus sp. IPA-1]|uniref:hypothetical protein n=1 Tax=Pelosinus sp. IPA-1 TaxID=3029569 RepID=UPI0024361C59|nr:hypothetical protein [Pelosinus sp. IPA-1]GMB00889.1 hypothetical protein PIPA1_36880 [Pelosinus sp. IPA-1]
MICARCGKSINEDTVNWTTTEDDDNSKPLCRDDRSCFKRMIYGKMVMVHRLAVRYVYE